MAGYVMNLDSASAVNDCIVNGVYGTQISDSTKLWNRQQEGTFADYAAMRAGDNIYFFHERKLFGVGELVEIGDSCRFLNYPGASEPHVQVYDAIRETLLWDNGAQAAQERWICAFKPSPYFFCEGIDMDDVLSSNPPAFRMLRVFSRLSFIKVDDDENQALMDIFLKRNLVNGNKPKTFEAHHQVAHARIKLLNGGGNYKLEAGPLMNACADGSRLGHEMAIEAGLLCQLTSGDAETLDVFGTWTYVSHQVVASPMKPPQWVDKMDVFGYSTLPNFERTRVKYLVCEIKRSIAVEEEVDQLMKYVDWVKDEYCHGDYSEIKAFLVAYDFPETVVQHRDDVARRGFTINRRPAQPSTWKDLTLVRYKFDDNACKLLFQRHHSS